jgi:ubiquitin carboxyl-terminal hydrolase 1
MSSWQQQDAQEYYSKILDEIDKEIAGLTKIQAVTKSFRPELMLSQFGQQRSTLRTVENTPTSGLRNPLEGLLAQRVGCTQCGYSEGLSMIPFNCLTVPLGKAFSYDVSDCLNEYTKLETIPGVECGKCTLLKTQRLLKLLLEKSESSQQDDTKRNTIAARHQAVTEALEDDDYEERTLTQKCHLPRQSRMNTNKSRQAVIARPPQSLVVHVNRSLFDERTGDLKKNYAEVHFPKSLDLGPWCLGSVGNTTDKDCEEWLLNPTESMIAGTETQSKLRGPLYELRAVITHYGRHENGHYICYRKHPFIEDSKDGSSVKEQWWRLSDDDVSKVTEDDVLSQSGVFMLFYDCVEGASFVNSRQETSEKTSVPESVDDTVLAIDTPLSINEGRGVTNLDTDMEPKAAMAVEDVAAVTSDDEDDTSAADYSYEPAKPIHIPGRVRGKEVYAEDDVQGARLQAPSMVMV